MNFTRKLRGKSISLYQYFLKIPSTNTKVKTAMYANMKRMNNEMAVSPIVATLVLIVVAVIGAVAVGTIMGTFSTSVSKQANSAQAGSASQTEILVAGSTTVDPITQLAGKLYTAQNPGIKVTSQAIASGAGVQAVGNGIADIGAVSETVKPAWTTQFPNLQQYQIGEGAIAIITNAAKPGVTGTLTYADQQALFLPTTDPNNGGSTDSAVVKSWGYAPVVIRADSSGTATTFYGYLGNSSQQTSGLENFTAVNGNSGVISAVGSTNYAIGFADYGDSVNAASSVSGYSPTIKIVTYSDATGQVYPAASTTDAYHYDTAANITANWNALRSEAKAIYGATVETSAGLPAQSGSAEKAWNESLFRPLIYLTNGQPSSGVINYIHYVQSGPIDTTNTGAKEGIFQETNNFGLADIS